MYAKEIEHYKSELDKNLNRLSAINEKELYISKLQYEKEFSIYLDLWERIHEIIHSTISIIDFIDDFDLPFQEQKRKDKKRINLLIDKYSEYCTDIERYSPFYKTEFYNKFLKIKSLCSEAGYIYKFLRVDTSYSSYKEMKENVNKEKYKIKEIPEELELLKKELQNELREYLLGLRLN